MGAGVGSNAPIIGFNNSNAKMFTLVSASAHSATWMHFVAHLRPQKGLALLLPNSPTPLR